MQLLLTFTLFLSPVAVLVERGSAACSGHGDWIDQFFDLPSGVLGRFRDQTVPGGCSHPSISRR
jgi:hypothetical protein